MHLLGHKFLPIRITNGNVFMNCEADGLELTFFQCCIVYVKIQATPFLTFSEENIPQNTFNHLNVYFKMIFQFGR
jgi:hypothetical protein